MKLHKLLFCVLTACLISSCSINDKIEDSESISTESSSSESSNIVDNSSSENDIIKSPIDFGCSFTPSIVTRFSALKEQNKSDIEFTIEFGHDEYLARDWDLILSKWNLENHKSFAIVREIYNLENELIDYYAHPIDDFLSNKYNYQYIWTTYPDDYIEITDVNFNCSFVDKFDISKHTVGKISYSIELVENNEIIPENEEIQVHMGVVQRRYVVYFIIEEDMCKFSWYEKDIK